MTGASIGILRFDTVGAERFVAELERTMRTPEGPKLWYLSAIDRLAKAGVAVRVESIETLQWAELDFPADLVRCRALAAAWSAQQAVPAAGESGTAAIES